MKHNSRDFYCIMVTTDGAYKNYYLRFFRNINLQIYDLISLFFSLVKKYTNNTKWLCSIDPEPNGNNLRNYFLTFEIKDSLETYWSHI